MLSQRGHSRGSLITLCSGCPCSSLRMEGGGMWRGTPVDRALEGQGIGSLAQKKKKADFNRLCERTDEMSEDKYTQLFILK